VKRIFLPPSIDHQAWNLPLATKHGNLLLLLPLTSKLWIDLHLPSPSLEKGDWNDGSSLFSPNIVFISILRILVPTSFLRRKRMISPGSWEKGGEWNENLVVVLKE
jgi:hypothetical protein